MRTSVERCDDDRLQWLLHADEDSVEFRMAAQHVEHCEHCQERLSQLAGEAQDWGQTRELLQPVEADSQFLSECQDRTWSASFTEPDHGRLPPESAWSEAMSRQF